MTIEDFAVLYLAIGAIIAAVRVLPVALSDNEGFRQHIAFGARHGFGPRVAFAMWLIAGVLMFLEITLFWPWWGVRR